MVSMSGCTLDISIHVVPSSHQSPHSFLEGLIFRLCNDHMLDNTWSHFPFIMSGNLKVIASSPRHSQILCWPGDETSKVILQNKQSDLRRGLHVLNQVSLIQIKRVHTYSCQAGLVSLRYLHTSIFTLVPSLFPCLIFRHCNDHMLENRETT